MKILITFLLFFTLTTLHSQNDNRGNNNRGMGNYPDQIITPDLETPTIQLDPDNFILDKEISPDEYIIGPGDQFDLFFGGSLQQHNYLTVLPNGDIIIPDLGALHLSGLTISEAENYFKSKYSKFYRTDEIKLILTRIRKFRVYISGQITNPGVYFMQNTDRVSSLIQESGGMAGWSDPSRIEVIRKDTTIYTNLWAFFHFGEISQNPYLQQGDIVKIPPIDLTKPYVIVYNTKGSEQYVPIFRNEEIKDFLDRTNSLGNRSDINRIEFIRNDSTYFINLLEADRDKIILESKDQITIPILRGEVYVTGQVLKPGPYSYIPDYTAWDYISKAGIVESSDDIHEVMVYRFQSDVIEHGSAVIVNKGDIVFLGRKIREDYKDWTAILTPLLSLLLSVYIAFGK